MEGIFSLNFTSVPAVIKLLCRLVKLNDCLIIIFIS